MYRLYRTFPLDMLKSQLSLRVGNQGVKESIARLLGVVWVGENAIESIASKCGARARVGLCVCGHVVKPPSRWVLQVRPYLRAQAQDARTLDFLPTVCWKGPL